MYCICIVGKKNIHVGVLTNDVRILQFSVRISPWILTKDPRPQQ